MPRTMLDILAKLQEDSEAETIFTSLANSLRASVLSFQIKLLWVFLVYIIMLGFGGFAQSHGQLQMSSFLATTVLGYRLQLVDCTNS